MENLCILMLDDPDFVMDMCEFWGDFMTRLMDRILPYVQLDYAALVRGHGVQEP